MVADASEPEGPQSFRNLIGSWVLDALADRQPASIVQTELRVEVDKVECVPLLHFVGCRGQQLVNASVD